MRGCKLKRKLNRMFLCGQGQNVIKKRYTQGSEVMGIFGEPSDGTWTFAETTIKIVIKTDKRHVDETLVGGLPESDSKELLHFYVSADEDIKIGDKIVYPVDTPNEWIVFSVIPTVVGSVEVTTEVKCHRDRRY